MKECKDKRVLVIGGMGFIGCNVSRALVNNNSEVTVTTSSVQSFGTNKFNLNDVEGRYTHKILDIRDRISLLNLVKGFDIIYNFAGQPAHNKSLDDPHLDKDINLDGHLNLLQACKINNPDAKILYAGSRMQLGKINHFPVNEEHPSKPKSPYGVSKQAAEDYSQYFFREEGLDTVVFRISNPYGPRAQMRKSEYCIVNWFLGQLMNGKDVTVYGDGNQLRDYIFIEDLVDAYLLAGVSPNSKGQVFNVGSGIGTRFKEMVDILIETVGGGKRVNVPWPKSYHNIETGDYVSDISNIKNSLSWTPKISLRDGLERTYEFYKEFGEHYFNP